MLFRPRFSFFREKDDGAGGSPPSTPPPATPPAATTPTSGDGTPPPPAGALADKDGKGTGEEIKFTPAALKERLDRAEKSAQASLAKSLGYDTVEAMQAAVEEGQKALREKMTAEEQLKADLETERKSRVAADERASLAEQSATQARLESAALGLMAGKFADPKMAFRLLDMANVDLTDTQFKGLPEAINQLAEAAPWTLLQTNPKTGKPLAPPIGPTNPEGGAPSSGRTDEERRQRYFGGGVKNSNFFQGGGVRGQQVQSQRIGGGS